MKLRMLAGQTARYTIVGGVCAGANNVAIIGGSLVGLNYVVTSVAAFFIVTPLAYYLHTSITFKQHRTFWGLLRFSAGVATNFPLFLVCMAVFVTWLNVPVFIAAPVVTVLLFFWSYALANWAVRSTARRLLRTGETVVPARRRDGPE